MPTDSIIIRSHRDGKDRPEAGAILIFVALTLVILIGMIGLAVDLGHAYVNKSQLQNIADACALAGASALNNTASGIQEAEYRATDINGSLANKYEFNSQAVSIPASAVTYSTDLNGTYIHREAAQAIANRIRFVRVRVTDQPSDVYFAKVIPGIPSVINVGAEAVAGQEPLTKICSGVDPFVARPIYPSDPPSYGYFAGDRFGYEPGMIYEVRVPGGSSGGGAKSCSDYGITGSVTGNFGLSDPANLHPDIETFRDNIGIGAIGHCVQVGSASLPSMTGLGGAAVLNAIIERFYQDTDQNPYLTYADYLNNYATNNTVTNYRRIVKIPFNNGEFPAGNSGPYIVTGFGCFFMTTAPGGGNPSNAICLMYIGQCDISGAPDNNPSPNITKIILYR